MASVKELLKLLAEDGAALTREQAAHVLTEILSGEVPEVETAALLAVLATRGEQAPELAGFVETMRARATPVPLTAEEREQLVDTCGSGGGGPVTFNISTGAALVAAAAGAKVAKHGNRAVTSLAGSADVLEALGVPINLGPELAAACLRETGFMFLFAPLYHPAMKVVGPLRKALGFRTIFNLCGPLTNPAGARAQVIGVLAPSRVLLMARTLAALGAKRAFVVHGTDGIDELTTTGESVVARVEEPEGGGHGLSYTTFEYSGLEIEKASNGGLDVKVNIKNSGSVAGDEVPQVYLGAPSEIPAGVQFPVRALAAFDRIHLGAGEDKTVTLHVQPRQLQYWSKKDGKWVDASGKRTVSVGASSRDLRVDQAVN